MESARDISYEIWAAIDKNWGDADACYTEIDKIIEADRAAVRKECAERAIVELESWKGQDWSDLSKKETANLIKSCLRAAIEGKESI